MKKKRNRTQMTRIERNLPDGSQVNTDLIREDQSNQRHPRSIPTNWSWVKLGDVCETITKVKDFKRNGSVYYLDIGGINNKTNSIESVKEYEWRKAPSRAKQIVLNGDILFSTVRTYLKNIARVPSQYGNQIASTGFCVIRPIKNILIPEYIFYLTLFDNFLEPLNALQVGSSYPAVRNGDVLKQIIPLPPLPEQKKIVEKIEELFSRLDSGVASLKKAKEQLRLYRQSVLSAAFSGRLTREVGSRQLAVGKKEMLKAAEPKVDYGNNGLPEGWKWVKIGEVSRKIQYGFTESAVSEKIGPKFLRITDIQNGNVDWESVPYCKITEDKKNKYLLAEGDILFARTGATVGKSFLINGKIPESIFASYLIRIQLSDLVSKKFIYYYFQSNNYWHQITEGQVGIGQPNVNGTKLSQLIIPSCSLEEQTKIVSEIEKRFSEADNLEKAIDESLEKSEALRQSILKQAFEGKLV